MRKAFIASLVLVGLFVGRAEAQYNPYGPQQNVPLAVILGGGWSQCYAADMGVPIGNDAENILTPCQGENIMMAGRVSGSDVFLLLAAGNRADVTLDVGDGADAHHPVNGSEWYFSPSWSWGFAPLGAYTDRFSCDKVGSPSFDPTGPDGDKRMCLHTADGFGGWRIGLADFLNSPPSGFEKVFFVNDSNVVPEPASIALLGTGLVGIYGAVRRRRGKKQV